MVADFARDMNLSAEDIVDVARRVREGDMTLILGAYESDLKVIPDVRLTSLPFIDAISAQSPLKSAITGSLVRTLLIQIQKVKVG